MCKGVGSTELSAVQGKGVKSSWLKCQKRNKAEAGETPGKSILKVEFVSSQTQMTSQWQKDHTRKEDKQSAWTSL